MKAILEIIGGCVGAAFFGALGGWVFWLALRLDDVELRGGKSPYSGFTPGCPVWRVGTEGCFDGWYESSRTGGGSARRNNE